MCVILPVQIHIHQILHTKGQQTLNEYLTLKGLRQIQDLQGLPGRCLNFALGRGLFLGRLQAQTGSVFDGGGREGRQ